MTNYSPFRYPGGKGKLAHYLAAVMRHNNIAGYDYVEPFAGGAGVALALLFCEQVSNIHINDIDPSIHSFWASAVHDTDALVELIEETPVTIESWHHAREVRRRPEQYSILDRGFSTLFLNRTNRSGILNGGPIGGLDQTGSYKIDCRFNKPDVVSKIRRIGLFRSRINVHSEDGSSFISKLEKTTDRKLFFYIDPPYYVKGSSLYRNHFVHNDHEKLRDAIKKLRSPWIVSYDNNHNIRDMYSDYEQENFDIDYTARSYSKGKEVMIYSDGIRRHIEVYCSEKERRVRLNEGTAFA